MPVREVVVAGNDVEMDLARRAEQLASGQVSNSLLLQLLSDLGILNERLSHADRQRTDIVEKLNEALKGLSTITALSDRLDKIESHDELNTEFRLKFMGGSMVVRLIWIALGGAAVIILQKLWPH